MFGRYLKGKLKDQSGLTLTEVMIATGLSMIVLLGATYLLTEVTAKKKTLTSAGDTETTRRLIRNAVESQLRKSIPLKVWLNPQILTAFGVPTIAGGPNGMSHSGLVLDRHCLVEAATHAPDNFASSGCPNPDKADVALFLSKPWTSHPLTVADNPTVTDPNADPAFYIFLSATTPPTTPTSGSLYVTAEGNDTSEYHPGDLIGISTPQGVMVATLTALTPVSAQIHKLDFSVNGLGQFQISGVSQNMPVGVISSGAAVFRLALSAVGVERDSRQIAMGYKELNVTSATTGKLSIEKFQAQLEELTIGDELQTDFSYALQAGRSDGISFLPKARSVHMRFRMPRDMLYRNNLSENHGASQTTMTEIIIAI